MLHLLFLFSAVTADYDPTCFFHTNHLHLHVDTNNSFDIVGLHNVLQIEAERKPIPKEYMVAKENLTARVMSFEYPNGIAERTDDLLRDLAQGLCQFKPFRLPLEELRNEDGRNIYATIQLGAAFKAHFTNTLNKHGFLDYTYRKEHEAKVVLAHVPLTSPAQPLLTWPEKQFYPDFVQYIPRISMIHCWPSKDPSKLPECHTHASIEAEC